jgi:GPI-anchor transamidase subunit K
MAFGRRSPGSSRHPPALTIVTALLLASLYFAAAAAALSPTDAMHNNNWAVLVCTSRFW